MSILISTIYDNIIGRRTSSILNDSTKQYSPFYKGEINDISLYSCRFLASRLNDIYDDENNKLVKNKYLELPYFELIASMTSNNKILL